MLHKAIHTQVKNKSFMFSLDNHKDLILTFQHLYRWLLQGNERTKWYSNIKVTKWVWSGKCLCINVHAYECANDGAIGWIGTNYWCEQGTMSLGEGSTFSIHWADVPGLDQTSWVPVGLALSTSVNPVLLSPWRFSYGRDILVTFPHCSLVLYSTSKGAAWLSHICLCTVGILYTTPFCWSTVTESLQVAGWVFGLVWVSLRLQASPRLSWWYLKGPECHCWWSPCVVIIYANISIILRFCLGEGWGWLSYEPLGVAIAFQRLHHPNLFHPADSIRWEVSGTSE